MGCYPLEFATTACCRPLIVEKTYSSFTNNLLGIDWQKSTLYLNVDPIPDNCDPMEVVEVAKKYFGNVVYNIPEKPNFTKAIHWCFQQPIEEMFFYLQDDWIMVRKVRIQELKKIINTRVRISKYNKSTAQIINVILRAYRSITNNRICLSPSLINTKWAKEYSDKLDYSLNPERQFRPRSKANSGGGQASNKNYVGCQYPINPRNGICVKDLGRPWLKENKFRRNSTKWKFNQWIKCGQKYSKGKIIDDQSEDIKSEDIKSEDF